MKLKLCAKCSHARGLFEGGRDDFEQLLIASFGLCDDCGDYFGPWGEALFVWRKKEEKKL
jgi:hypothetical protein